MYRCALAPGPVDDATYVVRALASSWNPATVTFNALPQLYATGAVGLEAPTAGGMRAWDVTPSWTTSLPAATTRTTRRRPTAAWSRPVAP